MRRPHSGLSQGTALDALRSTSRTLAERNEGSSEGRRGVGSSFDSTKGPQALHPGFLLIKEAHGTPSSINRHKPPAEGTCSWGTALALHRLGLGVRGRQPAPSSRSRMPPLPLWGAVGEVVAVFAGEDPPPPKGRPKKNTGDPRGGCGVGGSEAKKDWGQIFELPSPRNAQKRD
jgi:hypothetical protein